LRTPRRSRRERFLVALLQVLHRMPLARIDRRIEQHQRFVAGSVLERMHRGRHPRERMKQTRGALRTKLTIYRVPDRLHVFDKVLPGMTLGSVKRLMPLILEIEDDDLVTIATRAPQRKVPLNR